MEESITRSFSKLKEALDVGEHQANAASFARKTESYEAKKAHYGPAIDRVLAIIDRGVQERLTVNGEILRLQSDMRLRWTALQTQMRDIDQKLEDLNSESCERLSRDSLSTVMSGDRSVASSLADTPASSPASSVVDGSGSIPGSRTPTPLVNGKWRHSSSRIPSSIQKRIPLTQSGDFSPMSSSSPLATRIGSTIAYRPEPSPSNRPRWQIAMRTQNRDFLPLSALEPSPYAKAPVAKHTNYLRSSSNPLSSTTQQTPMSRKVSTPNVASPKTSSSLPKAAALQSANRKSGLPVPSLASRKSYSGLRSTSQLTSAGRRSSPIPTLPDLPDGHEADSESPSHHKPRASSSLSSGRRTNLLPGRAKGTVQ